MLRPPTSSLPPLARLASYSTEQIDEALKNLRALYTRQPMPSLPAVAKALPKHLIHDTSVPDSGYASAEEDEDPCAASGDGDEADAAEQLEGLRSDPFECEFAIRWLTAFAARSDAWVYESGVPDEEDARAQLVDEAAALLASFAGDEDEEETALTRDFSFPGGVEVVLNDAPLDSQDHTSVGLQSWGSAIIFAERMCADPFAFGLAGHGLRVLELGAGTGLLSIAAAKLFEKSHSPSEIVATDYHPSVLENLRLNVSTNRAPIAVHALDWQSPCYDSPFDAPFDVILAADVIYHPNHARWIKNCVERLLLRPSSHADGGVFWLIIPVRSTGRHEGMGSTVKAVFPTASAVKASGATGEQLAILSTEEMGKLGGIGRADESGYTLFRIGWVTA